MPKDMNQIQDLTQLEMMDIYKHIHTNSMPGQGEKVKRITDKARDMGNCIMLSCPSDRDYCVSYGLSLITALVYDTDPIEPQQIKQPEDKDEMKSRLYAEYMDNFNYWAEQLGQGPKLSALTENLQRNAPALLRKICYDADS